ncbi:transmembrane protein, putative (macronuclear) [Tetrahymena thermophila SB210]|uniref:Transmembrane protein, putative n=1 Tax=Tetrahymena thermophila (strain SB210) TaxID=312017 RepID=Q23PU2_TETTS|nr:transmembrane protein, putative [Tetrahymena thermophila SB210]EAR98593.1 transmembrane protein, putative [Tetrahymena thermophila SB210]|eukprot:XP_001018838.1 transmembrane protein, putative [Tetrahymena thermophila SB210]
MPDNRNIALAWCVVSLPLALGVIIEVYQYFLTWRYIKKKYSHKKYNYLKIHLNQMYQDSIFRFLDPKSSNQVQQENEDSSQDSENESNEEDQIYTKYPDTGQSCFAQQNSKINRDQLSSAGELSEQLIRQNEQQDNNDNNNNDQQQQSWCNSIQIGKILFFTTYFSNILTVPLIYSLTLIKDTQKEQEEYYQFILQALALMFLHFLLNFTMFLYGSIITGQGILLLIYLRQQENQIKTYIQSCIYRSFCFSIIFLTAQIFLFALMLVQGHYIIEYLQKCPLILIGRYLASFYISQTLNSSFSNQKIFKKKRLMSLYNKYYTKYYNEQKLNEELTKKIGQFPTSQQTKQFLSYKQKQAIQYLEKMEKNLTENKDFKLDQILTNKHLNIQLYITVLYKFIFTYFQLGLMGIAIYFLWLQIPFSAYDYLSAHDYSLNGNQFQNIQEIQNDYYKAHYLNNSNSCFQGDFFLESDSGALLVFNIFILLQALLMTLVRFSLKTKFILNENTRNRLIQ